MKKAAYFATLEKPVKGLIVAHGFNADGPTVTLAEKAGSEPFIVGAPVSLNPQAGFAVIDVESEVVSKSKK